MYGCESSTIKKAVPKNWCLQITVLEKTLESPLDSKEIKQSILKEINAKYSLEGLLLKLKLQYFVYLMWRAESLEKDPDAGKDWGQEEKGTTEDEMAGCHHRLNGHELEQTPGDGEGQGSVTCCGPRGRRVGQAWANEQQWHGAGVSGWLLVPYLYRGVNQRPGRIWWAL